MCVQKLSFVSAIYTLLSSMIASIPSANLTVSSSKWNLIRLESYYYLGHGHSNLRAAPLAMQDVVYLLEMKVLASLSAT